MQLSVEQRQIVELLAHSNVYVDSIAGCGKTTACLGVADAMPSRKILLLTYNSKLRKETQKRAVGLTNLDVHTYHSFAYNYYTKEAKDDLGLIKAVDMRRLRSFCYDLIMVDEVQDMKNLLFKTFYKIYADNDRKARVCVLGDRHQCIYGYQGSDSRFLTLAPQVFHFAPGSWCKAELSVSYRITIPMANFVNECMFGYKKMTAVKESSVLPEYIVCDAFASRDKYNDLYDPVFNRLMDLFEQGYKEDDIFVLGYSVKTATMPLLELESKIKLRTTKNTFTPLSDDSELTDEVTENKLVFCTFHQAKGRERKVVLVMGFDMTFFEFYAKTEEPSVCPNLLYVATTRATEKLILIQAHKHKPLAFLQKKEEFCDVHVSTNLSECTNPSCVFSYHKTGEVCRHFEKEPKKTKNCVTDIVRHMDLKVMKECFDMLEICEIQPAGEAMEIQNKIKGESTTEEVSDFTGTAIPTYYEYAVKNESIIVQKLNSREVRFPIRLAEIEGIQLPHKLGKFPHGVSEWLFFAAVWDACNNGFLGRLMQIKTFDWMTEEQLSACTDRLHFVLERVGMKPNQFEYEVKGEWRDREIVGLADIVDEAHLIEIKCVKELRYQHYMQLVLYMYLHKVPKNYLFNALTNELVEVACSDEVLQEIVAKLCHSKFGKKDTFTDEQFLTHNAVPPIPKKDVLLTDFFKKKK